MLAPGPYFPAVFSLGAVGAWGTSDFLGGLGARRVNAFLFTLFVHLSGMLLASFLALAMGVPFPASRSLLWALAAGTFGGLALAIFYRALAAGKMGLVAPLAAVIGAAIPAIVTAFSEGFPGARHVVGFVLAGIGVWFISRTESTTEEEDARPQGLGMAVLAGLGFVGFYLCIHHAGSGSALWIAVCSRFASVVVTLAVVVVGRQFSAITRPILAVTIITGVLDISGSIGFIRAAQIGRLDAAVVLTSLYPAVTVILARIFLHEHFSRARTLGMFAALVAVPLIVG